MFATDFHFQYLLQKGLKSFKGSISSKGMNNKHKQQTTNTKHQTPNTKQIINNK
jgi:hypothetical protein